MNRLTLELVIAAIARSPRRFATQAIVVAVVVAAGCGALGVARSGTDALSASITESGALRYELNAVDSATGQPAPFRLESLELLEAADNVKHATAEVFLNDEATPSSGIEPASMVGALAVAPSYFEAVDWTLKAGTAPFDPRSVDADIHATLGSTAANKLGVTPGCVATRACVVLIGGARFPVSSVAVFDDPALDNTAFVSLSAAIDAELSAGPTTLIAEAEGLPTSSVADSLDVIVSGNGRTVFVTAPDTGGELRSGLADTWGSTITTVAIVLMGLGAVAQIAMQLTTIRFRRAEIATLRSLGCTPAAVVAQFTLEPAIVALAGAGAGLVGSTTAVRVLARLDVDAALPLNGAVAIAAAAVVSTTAASYLAARSTARVAPAEVIGT